MDKKRKAEGTGGRGNKKQRKEERGDGPAIRRKRRKRSGFDSSDDEPTPSLPASSTSTPGPSSAPAVAAVAPSKSRHRPLAPAGFEFTWDSVTGEMPTILPPRMPEPLPEPTAKKAPDSQPVPEMTEKFGPLQNKPKRPQGASTAVAAVLPILPDIQTGILATFAHPRLGCQCDCGADEAVFRCMECYNAPLWCRQCIVREHRYNPFHHIEKWEGKLFVRHSLAKPKQQKSTANEPQSPSTPPESKQEERPSNLLLQTHLLLAGEPNGKPCRNAHPTTPNVREFTIAEHNGFHTRQIQFCQCATRKDDQEWQQLLAVRLFPATFKHPQTAFTFTAMKQFHIHSLASKKSAYDYVKALCMLTDNASHHAVTDRYREFLFACRIWRFLALQRRSGQAHNIDFWVKHRRANSLTVRCPACPEVGFNISAETMRAALKTERHKFTLFLSVDGNFKLQRKNKRSDPNDFALNDGNGYFVETEDYKSYLRVARPSAEEELGTCSHLRAARMQNIAKFKNAVITGVVAVQCARHGFYMPQGMVDLTKGEAFANTDYATCFALAEALPQRWIRFTYDIWCHYGINLPSRIQHLFPSMLSIIDKVDGAIPKMHILNHIARCQFEWNLNWLPYSGFTVGEMIETGWAVHNLTAGSTKEMNTGHRHDIVDDTSNHWNFEKMITLASTLLRLYRLAVSERRTRTRNFEAVDKQQRNQYPKAVPQWEAMNIKPRIEKGQFFSVFQANFKKGPPTHAAAYAKLLEAEMDAEKRSKAKQEAADQEEAAAARAAEDEGEGEAQVPAEAQGETKSQGEAAKVARKGDLAIIGDALLLERDREHIKRLVHMSAGDDIVRTARSRFITDIQALRTRQIRRVPEFSTRMSEIDPDKPENTKLFLPSQFHAAQRAAMNLDAMAQVEYTLREAQAYDALLDLRTAIKTFNYNKMIKKDDIHGTGATTRAQDYLKTLHNDTLLAADTYRRMRAALVVLGLPNDDTTLRPLEKKTKLEGKAGRAVALGDSRKGEPWFWSMLRPPGMSDEEETEWEMEMDRVKWFRDRALRDRAIEEQETLEAEFDRVQEWFRRNSEVWEEIANERDSESRSEGSRAYVHKQAGLYRKLCERCKGEWARAPGLVKKDEEEEEEKARRDAIKATAEAGGGEFTTDFSEYYDVVV